MFTHPLGLLALLAVPAVVALHLFRRRFEPHTVSALFLWRVEDAAPVAGRRREPLRTSASFWCEVLAAAALGLVFAGPRAGCAAARGEHLVVVLDSSASMGAEGEDGSARARAVDELGARIRALPRGSRVTLLTSGARPALLAGPAAFPSEARARLEDWRPRAGAHDLGPAVALGLELAGEGSVLLVTDHFDPEAWPEAVELLSLGRPLDNWALTHAARTSEHDAQGVEHERVFVSVTSFASTAHELELSLDSAGGRLASERRRLEPGARTHLAFTLPPDAGVVTLRLAPDGLGLDDVAWLVPAPPRTLALFSELAESDTRALGLVRGERPLGRWLDLVPHAIEAPSAALAHLVLARTPSAAPAAWSLVLAPLGAERRDWIGPFLAERGHPLLAGLTLEGAVWSADPERMLPGVPLVSAGNVPLLSEERVGGRVAWYLALDPERSSLQRSPDWPILLSNLAEERRAALPGPERTNLVVGEDFVYRPGNERSSSATGAPAEYRLEGPLGADDREARTVPALERVLVEGLERPGLYRLALGERALCEFSVNFSDASESDLRGARPGHRAARGSLARLEGELSWLELGLLAGVLGLVLADGAVLVRAARANRG